jgi:hypothetical protein
MLAKRITLDWPKLVDKKLPQAQVSIYHPRPIHMSKIQAACPRNWSRFIFLARLHLWTSVGPS